MMDFDSRHRFDDRFQMEEDREEEFQEEVKPLESSTTNKLKIKLKVCNDGGWICRLCRKEFSSAKSLGGHMRVHVHQPDDAGAGGFGPKRYLRDLERDGKPTCSLCNKTFLSLKSLFGHMRCHPERDWRGMKQPETFAAADSGGAANPSSTIDSDQADEPVQETEYCSSSGVDLLRHLEDNWSVKKPRSGAAIDVRSTMNEAEIGAVHALILLSTGKYRFTSIHDDDAIGDAEKLISSPEKPISSSNKKSIDGIQDQNYLCDDSDNSRIPQLDYEDQQMIDCTKDNTNLVMKKRKRMEDSFNNYQIINSAAKCYRCKVCNKTFTTPQALGGHKSSAHNKLQIKISLANPESTLNGGLGVLKPYNNCDNDQEDNNMTKIVTPVSHICKICDKAFPSGQALGGHMRRHWQGPSPAAGLMQMAVVSSDQSGLSSADINSDDTIKKPVLGFDLNELPDVDDDDAEEQGFDLKLTV